MNHNAVDCLSRCSRRSFLQNGVLSGISLSFGRAFAVPAGMADSAGLRLKFGVLSDIHISEYGAPDADELARPDNAKTFLKALAFLRDANVDAVMIPGDLTNGGFDHELRAVGRAWRQVFPDDRAADGRHVEKLFIGGNHDWEGWKYGRVGEKLYPDPDERACHLICNHLEALWLEVFGEPFSRVVDKEVQGYRFIGTHWPFHETVGKYLGESSLGLPRDRPFFYFQHPPPPGNQSDSASLRKGSCTATRFLADFPNAFSISGHTHSSVTDERSIVQRAFTSIDAGSLRFTAAPAGRENSGPMRNSEFKQMPMIATRDCRQGLIFSVYGDRIVVARREYVSGQPLGPDWVIPLDGSRPFDLARRAAAARPPQFPADAKLRLSTPSKGRTRGGAKRCQITLVVPQALPPDEACGRVMDYRVEVKMSQGGLVNETFAVRRFIADGFNKPVGAQPAEMACVLDDEALPHECQLTFEVRAADCFGNLSRPITLGPVKLKGIVVRW